MVTQRSFSKFVVIEYCNDGYIHVNVDNLDVTKPEHYLQFKNVQINQNQLITNKSTN